MAPNLVWLNGTLLDVDEVQVQLGARFLARAPHVSNRARGRPPWRPSAITWPRLSSNAELEHGRHCVQVWLPNHDLAFVGLALEWVEQDNPRLLGTVVELIASGNTAKPHAPRTFVDPVDVVLDGRKLGSGIQAARLAWTGAWEPGPATERRRVVLGLRLAPGLGPDDGFAELFQPHVGRELTIRSPSEPGLVLRGVRCDRAAMLVAPEHRRSPIDRSGPLEFALLLDCHAVEPLVGEPWIEAPLSLADIVALEGKPVAFRELGETLLRDWRPGDNCDRLPLTEAQAPPRDDAELDALAQRLVVRARERYPRGGPWTRVVTFTRQPEDSAALAARLRRQLEKLELPALAEVVVLGPDELIALAGDRAIPTLWLQRACRERDRAQHPLEAQLIRELDEDASVTSSAAWSVLTDHLLDIGDPYAVALAERRGPPDAEGRALWEASGGERVVGQRWQLPGREWAPRVWASWVGPFVTRLVVAPGWVSTGDGPHVRADAHERWPELVGFDVSPWRSGLLAELGRSVTHDSELPRIAAGEPLPIPSWNGFPGYDAWPELRAMLRLPCCRLTSPRRIVLAGDNPPSLDLVGADLRDFDLRGVELYRPHLQGASASGIKLCNARLIDASLDDADLREADLREARIWGDLRGADLRGADLRNADLAHARIAGALIDKARLDGLRVHEFYLDDWRALGASIERLRVDR